MYVCVHVCACSLRELSAWIRTLSKRLQVDALDSDIYGWVRSLPSALYITKPSSQGEE